jgi:voltage-gated potassium channel Kch
LLPFFKLFGPDRASGQKEEKEKFDVWIFGYHRIGWKIVEALKQMKISFAVVDFNPETIEKLKRNKIPTFFGDAADIEFLAGLPLSAARMIIFTLPDVPDQTTALEYLKKKKNKALVIANLYHAGSLEDLYAAGADYVMMPHLLGGHWISGILKHKPWTRRTLDILRREQKAEMRGRYTAGTHE